MNEALLVKIVNSNITPTMRRFCWLLYFGAQVYIVGDIREKH